MAGMRAAATRLALVTVALVAGLKLWWAISCATPSVTTPGPGGGRNVAAPTAEKQQAQQALALQVARLQQQLLEEQTKNRLLLDEARRPPLAQAGPKGHPAGPRLLTGADGHGKGYIGVPPDPRQKRSERLPDHRCVDKYALPTAYRRAGPLGVDEVVLCSTNWVAATEYLPEPDFYARYSSAEDQQWAADRDTMFERIEALQFPTNCDRHDQWHMMKWTVHGYGFNLMTFINRVGSHWEMQTPMVASNARYRYSTGDPACGGPGYLCWLSPLTNCSVERLKPSKVLVRAGWQMSVDQLCKPGVYSVQRGVCICPDGMVPWGRLHNKRGYDGCAPPSAIIEDECDRESSRAQKDMCKQRVQSEMARRIQPDDEPDPRDLARFNEQAGESVPGEMSFREATSDFERLPKPHKDSGFKAWGFFWWVSQLYLYFHRKAPKRPYLEAWFESLGMAPGKTCLAVHVRRGDSCTDKENMWKYCLPWSDYRRHIRVMEARYGPYDHVYLATDDEQVLAEAKRDVPHLIFQDVDRRHFDISTEQGGVDALARFNRPHMVESVAKDIWGMSSCDAFVGTLTSSVGYSALALMVGRKGHYVPYISLMRAFGDSHFAGQFMQSELFDFAEEPLPDVWEEPQWQH